VSSVRSSSSSQRVTLYAFAFVCFNTLIALCDKVEEVNIDILVDLSTFLSLFFCNSEIFPS
jgi:hypothetical protein